MWFWDSIAEAWATLASSDMVAAYGWVAGGAAIGLLAYSLPGIARDSWDGWSEWVTRRFPRQ